MTENLGGGEQGEEIRGEGKGWLEMKKYRGSGFQDGAG